MIKQSQNRKRSFIAALGTYRPSTSSLVVLLSVLSIALLAVAGCQQSSNIAPVATQEPRSVANATVPRDYVGNAVCAECHKADCDIYSASHHVHTLHLLNPAATTAVDPPQGSVTHTAFRVETFAGDYVVTQANNMSQMQPLVFAFGSGKIGVTYASPNGPQSLLEFHKTWFPHERRWATTLGQEGIQDDVVGRNRTDGRQCLICHTVTLPTGTLQPEPGFLGVGCESCHGPAGSHVQAIRAGAHDIAIERLGTWDATRINNLCGKCHGTAETIASKRDQQLTYRFQPIGLMGSRCFTAGGRSLSCITCHDPHRDADRTANHYEAICLRCHAPGGHAAGNGTTNKLAHVSCPVHPRDGCITCHMPGHQAVPNSDIVYRMADHKIAIYRSDIKVSRIAPPLRHAQATLQSFLSSR